MTTPEDRPGPKAEYFARMIAGPESAGARAALKAEASRMARERLTPFVPRPTEGTNDAARREITPQADV